MSYAIFVSLSDMFFQLIGNGVLMALFFSFVVIILLAAAKVTNPAVYFSILTPMLLGFIINPTSSNLIEVAPWIAFPILIVMAIFFGIALVKIFTE